MKQDLMVTYALATKLHEHKLASAAADASLSHSYIAAGDPNTGPDEFRTLPAEARLRLVRVLLFDQSHVSLKS